MSQRLEGAWNVWDEPEPELKEGDEWNEGAEWNEGDD